MKDTARLSPLGEEAKSWLVGQLQILRSYAIHFGINPSGQLLSNELDDLWAAWMEENVADLNSVDSFLNCFGIGFGQVLVDDCGFEWIYLEDEDGADIAVRALPDVADVRIAPLHFVLKRWQSKEGRFVVHSLSEIAKLLEDAASEQGIGR